MLQREGSLTDVARVRPLARVRPDVALKQPRSAKTLAAYFTFTRQRMGSNVHLERTQRRIRLLAVFTSEMFLYLRAAVKLLVFRQTAERRIALAAPITLVSSYSG